MPQLWTALLLSLYHLLKFQNSSVCVMSAAPSTHTSCSADGIARAVLCLAPKAPTEPWGNGGTLRVSEA